MIDHGDFRVGDLICYTIRTRHVTREVVRAVERVVVSGGLTMLFLAGGGWMQRQKPGKQQQEAGGREKQPRRAVFSQPKIRQVTA